jgi:hypothetical protein
VDGGSMSQSVGGDEVGLCGPEARSHWPQLKKRTERSNLILSR